MLCMLFSVQTLSVYLLVDPALHCIADALSNPIDSKHPLKPPSTVVCLKALEILPRFPVNRLVLTSTVDAVVPIGHGQKALL
jgi:F0F1-type ATP synthase alpha subunit